MSPLPLVNSLVIFVAGWRWHTELAPQDSCTDEYVGMHEYLCVLMK